MLNKLLVSAFLVVPGMASFPPASALQITLDTAREAIPARAIQPQGNHPKNIKEYYLLMPKEYDGRAQEERQELLESTDTFVDIKNGYIGAQQGRLGEIFQAAIFKKPDGSYIYVYNEDGDPDVNVATKLYLLKYEGGRWTDVTAELLPVPVNKRYAYNLPDVGTTIRVSTAKDKKLYELVWVNGKFEKK